MGQKSSLAPSSIFIQALRSALNHLYDPDYLRQSRLTLLFGVDQRFDTPSALQAILTRAIETLKPKHGAPNRAHAQAIYDLLIYRYVQQVSQEEIANQLGISARHFRRQQNLAIYDLASKLWEQYNLDSQERIVDEQLTQDEEVEPTSTPENDSGFSQELNWLKEPMQQNQTDLALVVPNALNLIQPLLNQNHTHIDIQSELNGLLIVHPVAFQQILLGLLSLTIQLGCDNPIHLTLVQQEGQHTLNLSGIRSGESKMGRKEEQLLLETVQKLVNLSQGSFTFHNQGVEFQADLVFRSITPVKVLVIDDNPEIITMMQRFSAESQYRITGLSDPQLTIDQALEYHPQIIVLDIMMPQVDGLQVMSRIKHHPDLGHIPVIVCSVLPQKELAVSLGASGFISKPFKPETFISTLDTVYKQSA